MQEQPAVGSNEVELSSPPTDGITSIRFLDNLLLVSSWDMVIVHKLTEQASADKFILYPASTSV